MPSFVTVGIWSMIVANTSENVMTATNGSVSNAFMIVITVESRFATAMSEKQWIRALCCALDAKQMYCAAIAWEHATNAVESAATTVSKTLVVF